MRVITSLLIGIFAWAGIAQAEVSHDKVLLAVLGEALHDSESMRYMAHAVLNRTKLYGDLRGIYGYKRALGVNYSPKVREKAVSALNKAIVEADPTSGATHWLSDYDLGHCRPERMAWRFKMVETAYQGQTNYYKEV